MHVSLFCQHQPRPITSNVENVLEEYATCNDPNNRNGLCQPIRSCDSILRLLTPPLSPQVREFLRRSQCKFENGQPWVCCTDAVAAPPPVPARRPTGLNSTGSGGSRLPSAPDCGIQAADRIVGGEPTAIDEFPWLVQIQYNKREFQNFFLALNAFTIFKPLLAGNKVGFHCGGSLINGRYVITAAHCVSKVPAEWNLSSVRIGEWDTKTNNPDCEYLQNEQVCNEAIVDVPVAEKIVHKDYQPSSKNQHHDIALLRLTSYVIYTDFVRPICLPLENVLRNSNENGKRFVVAGWGEFCEKIDCSAS